MTDPEPHEDWPPVTETSASDWQTAIDRMRASYGTLANAVEQLDDERLKDKVGSLDYTVYDLLHGVVEHGTYHAGQVAILKKRG